MKRGGRAAEAWALHRGATVTGMADGPQVVRTRGTTMTQQLRFHGRIPRGWIDLAHVLAGAPARRRREFAQTQPGFFRSECFAEDLGEMPPPRRIWQPVGQRERLAAWLCAVPLGSALLGAVLMMFEHAA
jgi:hypothetical protein